MPEDPSFDERRLTPESGRRSQESRYERAILQEVQQEEQKLESEIGQREVRRMQHIAQPPRTVWFGLGMFGLVGWSVTVPALIGVAVGLWIDTQWPGPWSWTLMLLMGGITIGCMNAWTWVSREARIDTARRSSASQKPGSGDRPGYQADRSERV